MNPIRASSLKRNASFYFYVTKKFLKMQSQNLNKNWSTDALKKLKVDRERKFPGENFDWQIRELDPRAYLPIVVQYHELMHADVCTHTSSQCKCWGPVLQISTRRVSLDLPLKIIRFAVTYYADYPFWWRNRSSSFPYMIRN